MRKTTGLITLISIGLATSQTGCQSNPSIESINLRHSSPVVDLSARDEVELVNMPSGDSTQSTQTAASSSSKKVDNQQLAHVVLSQLLADDRLSGLRLQVISNQGHILITGECESEDQIQAIKAIAGSVDQVTRVVTALTLGPKITSEQMVKDSINKRHAKDILARLDPPKNHLVVICNQNKLYILGSINDDEKNTIIRALSQLPVQSINFA